MENWSNLIQSWYNSNLTSRTHLNVSSAVEKLSMQKKDAKKHFLLFFHNIDFFRIAITDKGGDNSTMPDVTSYSCLCVIVCVCVCVCVI